MLSRYQNGPSARNLALEVFFLVAAVFLALAVDEAWESHEKREAAEVALSRIALELEKNHRLILAERDQHGLELAKVQPVIELLETGSPLPEDFDFNPNLSISILRNTAWQSAKVADVLKHLPYETIESLTAVYSLQELYRRQSSEAFNYLGDIEFIGAEPGLKVRSVHQTLLKIYSLEQVLLTAYDDAESRVEALNW